MRSSSIRRNRLKNAGVCSRAWHTDEVSFIAGHNKGDIFSQGRACTIPEGSSPTSLIVLDQISQIQHQECRSCSPCSALLRQRQPVACARPDAADSARGCRHRSSPHTDGCSHAQVLRNSSDRSSPSSARCSRHPTQLPHCHLHPQRVAPTAVASCIAGHRRQTWQEPTSKRPSDRVDRRRSVAGKRRPAIRQRHGRFS